MVDTLDVNTGETFTVPSGDQYEYLNADIDGTLDVNGSLVLKTGYDASTQPSEAKEEPELISTGPIDLPLEIDLPVGNLSFEKMETSVAILLIGILAVLGAAAATLRNYAAGVMLSMAVVALVLAGVFNLGVEIFYAFIVGASLLLAAGIAVSWSGA